MFVNEDDRFTFLGWMLLVTGALAIVSMLLQLFLIAAAIAIGGFVAVVVLGQLAKFFLIMTGRRDLVDRIEEDPDR